jgi:type I restriction-modification system DNA methylase subunit
MKVKKDVNFYYPLKEGHIRPKYDFHGFDKGFEKKEQLTIILAKANMLIFLSELLKNNDSIIDDFSDLLNNTFKLTTESIMGTLEKTEYDKYDLILTNPPYVTSGSSNYKDRIKTDERLKKFYNTNAMGVEGLFLEWIVNSVKPNRKALIVIPDGILHRINDEKLR